MSLFLIVAATLLASSTTVAQSGPWPSAPAFYPQTSRKTIVLNGTWSFGWSPNNTDAMNVPYAMILTPNVTFVPSSFDVAPAAIKGPRTTVFYKSTHTCTPGFTAKAKFYAVNFYTRIFVDGTELGNHTAGPYTPFSFTLPPCNAATGTRELALVVSNVFNKTLCPTCTGGDFYFYGGIIRPIVITELPLSNAVFIDRVEPLTIDVNARTMDVRVYLGGSGIGAASANLSITVNDSAVPITVGNFQITDNNLATVRITLPAAVVPWSIGNGNLFTLDVKATDSGDVWTTRTGLRVVSIVPPSGADNPQARIAINGQVVKLHGFNRHTMWPDTGAAVTLEQEAVDVARIQSINANYIRGGHYPQSQSFLDALDEAGVVIWEEALGPGVSTSDIQNPYFMTSQVAAVTSMVETSFSHPSVIIHGFFNEGPSNDVNACPGYATLSNTIIAAVGTPAARLATWASDKKSADKCFDSAQIVSFNDYPGWYSDKGDIADAAIAWKNHVDWVQANFPGKPFTVSETGGGGVYEWVNSSSPAPGPYWSQNYQDALVNADASYLLNDTRVSGVSLWLLMDFKGA
jgi:beta-glucuronidase